MIEISDVRKYNNEPHYFITEHARLRMFERNIKVDDIISVIGNGKIIKQYEDDKPFPSCLISGKDSLGNAVHVVISINEENINIITAYRPDPEIWNTDFTEKKGIES